MSPLPGRGSPAGRPGAIAGATLAVGLALAATGCAAGVSTVAASSAHTATRYRSASTHVRLGTGDVFAPAVAVLRTLDDTEITDLDATAHRCVAAVGDRTLTLRVIDYGAGGSRVSVTVGRGSDAADNQAFAERVVREICHAFGDHCDPATSQR